MTLTQTRPRQVPSYVYRACFLLIHQWYLNTFGLQVYKQQANELLSAVGGDLSLLTPEQRGQHTLFLTQARDTLYLTLDRLRTPCEDQLQSFIS